MNKNMIEPYEGWTAPTAPTPAFIYRCRTCRTWYVRAGAESQLCKCGHAGHHTATVNPHRWIEAFLNDDTEKTALTGKREGEP